MMTSTERAFVDRLRGAEMHWHFVQGSQAIRAELWLCGVVTLLIAIENSVRVTSRQLEGHDLNDGELGATRSNSLLRRGAEAGLPVQTLAFPEEIDFAAKLQNKEPYAEIVRVRHDLCHGNVLGWVNRELGPDDAFFTPECLRETALQLLGIADAWTEGLSAFRQEHGLRN